MPPPDGDAIEPVTNALPVHEVGLAYQPVPRAGTASRNLGEAGPAHPPPLSPGGLDGLVPGAGPAFALALLLAAQCRDARGWLGPVRVRRIAVELGLSEAALLALIDAAPRPPLALGDPMPWTGRRLPVLHEGVVVWADLFWRPDRGARRRRVGGFAARLVLPATGRIEIRGRLEEYRLDTVAETERVLPLPLAADLVDVYEGTVRRLGMSGGLTLRNIAS